MVFFRRILLRIVLSVIMLLSAVTISPPAEALTATYLFDLSTFTGTVPFDWARVCTDSTYKEIYAAFSDTVRIFGQTGMEIYRFNTYDLDAGTIMDMAVNAEGDLLLLSYKGSDYSVIVGDFKGRRKSSFTIQDLPAEFAGFSPNRMFYHEGRLYFASLSYLKVVVTDPSGKFIEGYDVAPLIDVKDDQRLENDMFAFSVTTQGEIIFTIPSRAKVYVLSPDRTVREFGKRGSGPGKFGVPAGITSDKDGNIIVSDTLRSFVQVFDKNFKFITEFGGRGLAPGKLIAPRDVYIDGENRVYVTQLRRRGISVFQLKSD